MSVGIQENIAAVIKAIKETRHQSLAEFSDDLEISRSALQEYMAGTGNPRITTVEHLAEKLGIDPIVLVSATFNPTQLKILLLLLDTTQAVSDLSEPKRQRFAQLLLEILSLWEADNHDPGNL